jgi:hypothetical protein
MDNEKLIAALEDISMEISDRSTSVEFGVNAVDYINGLSFQLDRIANALEQLVSIQKS